MLGTWFRGGYGTLLVPGRLLCFDRVVAMFRPVRSGRASCASVPALVSLMGLFLWPGAVSRAQPGAIDAPGRGAVWPLRVLASSHLRMLRLEAEGRTHLRIEGALEDDRGHGLGGRFLSLRLVSLGEGEGAVVEVPLRTDAAGRFAARIAWPAERPAQVHVLFEGERDRTEAKLDVDWDPRRPPRFLRLVWPEGRIAPPQRSQLPLRLHVLPPEGTAGWSFLVRTVGGERLAEGRIGEDGRAAVFLRLEGLARPGRHPLVTEVRSAEGSRLQAESSVLLPARVRLHASLQGSSDGEGWRLHLRASVGRGPLPHRLLAVFEEGEARRLRHLRTLSTDARGRLDLLLPAGASGPWRVRFEGEPPLLSEAEVRVAPPASASATAGPMDATIPWWWVWAPLLGVLLAWGLGVVIGRRGRGDAEEGGNAAEGPGVGPVPRLRLVGDAPEADVRTVRLRVLDRLSRRVLPAARLRLSPAGTAREREEEALAAVGFQGISDGRYLLRVFADGYVPESFELRVPHRGAWDGAIVSLESVRDRLDRRLEPLARTVLGARPSAPWERTTFAQLRAAARERGGAWGEAVASLFERAERLRYGPHLPRLEEAEALLREADALGSRAPRRPVRSQDAARSVAGARLAPDNERDEG